MAKVGAYGNYGQLELNQVAFPRDGRIEAQLPLDTTKFGRTGQVQTPADPTATPPVAEVRYENDVPCQVGMILKVNKVGKTGCITTTDTKGGAAGEIFALNYSTEHMYDERTPQLRYFAQFPADPADDFAYDMTRYDDFYPRLGYLAVGDRFTTNTVDADLADNYGSLAEGNYLTAGTDGYWTKIAGVGNAASAPVVQITNLTTMPDGSKAVKVVVVKA